MVVAVGLEDGLFDVLNLVRVFVVADDLAVDVASPCNAEGVLAFRDEVHVEGSVLFVDVGVGDLDVAGYGEESDIAGVDGLADRKSVV